MFTYATLPKHTMGRLIDYIVFYAISAIFRAYNGGTMGRKLKVKNLALKKKGLL